MHGAVVSTCALVDFPSILWGSTLGIWSKMYYTVMPMFKSVIDYIQLALVSFNLLFESGSYCWVVSRSCWKLIYKRCLWFHQSSPWNQTIWTPLSWGMDTKYYLIELDHKSGALRVIFLPFLISVTLLVNRQKVLVFQSIWALINSVPFLAFTFYPRAPAAYPVILS